MLKERNALVVSVGDRTPFDGLELYGWNLVRADNLDDLPKLVRRHHCTVGLFYCDQCDWGEIAKAWGHVARVSGSVSWIAVINHDDMEDDELRSLIARSFFDFYTLPINPERFHEVLGHAHGMAELRRGMRHEPGTEEIDFKIIGRSKAISKLFALIYKVSETDLPVLINGESGTGKELTTQAIHAHSVRASGPCIEVNCGAIPPSLIQSELFGHEKGAFTGAAKRKIGLIEAAHGGTLFLDEIGDLPLEIQAHLLRFLQEQTIRRLGSTSKIHVDARVVAATHVDLEKAVADGRFREDLYYRINVLPVTVPPLRERKGDVEVLARHFLSTLDSDLVRHVNGFSEAAIRAMNDHRWPGNVRELINRVHRAAILSEGSEISVFDLGLGDDESQGRRIHSLDEARAQAEKRAIRQALAETGYTVSHAAKLLGTSRRTLYRLLEKHQIPSDPSGIDGDSGLLS
jgi:DNA-binding NtrC family response regulator